MAGPEQQKPHHRFRVKDYLERRKSAKDFMLLEHQGEKWRSLMQSKTGDFTLSQSVARFTHAKEGSTDATYYTLVYSPQLSVLFIDRNRDVGKGERYAIAVTPDASCCLETYNPIDKSGDKNPHEWRVVVGVERQKDIMVKRYASFKDAPKHDSTKNVAWKGYYPSVEEISSVIFSQPQEELLRHG